MTMCFPTWRPLPLLLIVAIVLGKGVDANLQAVLLSKEEPKLAYFTGDDVIGVSTYQKAQQFCADKGRVLASRIEWCRDWYDNPSKSNLYGGLQDDEEWAPIRTQRGLKYDVNEWLQVGHYEGRINMQNVCRTYKELHGIEEDTGELVVLPDEASMEPHFCEKPYGCEENTCVFWCNHEEGYYPDPHDCSSYCYCSGKTGKPSFWQRVEGEGLLWDPFCGDSGPLDESKSPLG